MFRGEPGVETAYYQEARVRVVKKILNLHVRIGEESDLAHPGFLRKKHTKDRKFYD